MVNHLILSNQPQLFAIYNLVREEHYGSLVKATIDQIYTKHGANYFFINPLMRSCNVLCGRKFDYIIIQQEIELSQDWKEQIQFHMGTFKATKCTFSLPTVLC